MTHSWKTKILLSLLIGFFPVIAMGSCSNGYCPNAKSPVVGGYGSTHFGDLISYSSYGSYTYRCGHYSTCYGGGWSTAYKCPNGTAEISVPGSYLADNGRWYSVTTLCVLTDTTGGWYGGEK